MARPGGLVAEERAALILLHGRGATAESILSLADYLPHADMAYLAPQAANYTWYPYSFLAPMEQNEPWLSSALRRVGGVGGAGAAGGIPLKRSLLAGGPPGGVVASEELRRPGTGPGGIIGLLGWRRTPARAPRAR